MVISGDSLQHDNSILSTFQNGYGVAQKKRMKMLVYLYIGMYGQTYVFALLGRHSCLPLEFVHFIQ